MTKIKPNPMKADATIVAEHVNGTRILVYLYGPVDQARDERERVIALHRLNQMSPAPPRVERRAPREEHPANIWSDDGIRG